MLSEENNKSTKLNTVENLHIYDLASWADLLLWKNKVEIVVIQKGIINH